MNALAAKHPYTLVVVAIAENQVKLSDSTMR